MGSMRHNNRLTNSRLGQAYWQRHVRTNFNQPAQKKARRTARLQKAIAVFPRPIDCLRPVVQCPTKRYNVKARAGRGFTRKELNAAGITDSQRVKFNIPIDSRRINRSQEGLDRNVERLKCYMSKVSVPTADVLSTLKPTVKRISDMLPIQTHSYKVKQAPVFMAVPKDLPSAHETTRKVHTDRIARRYAGQEANKN